MVYKCEFCDKVYKSVYEKNNIINLNKHKLYCNSNPNRILYECKYCGKGEKSGVILGAHVSNCLENPNYEEIKKSQREKGRDGRPHSEKTKKKISEKRIKYLLDNPDKVPYKVNHSSRESYPEKYFTELFIKENISVEKKFRIGLYELDFCILEKKIDIEIDGCQHYVDKKIVDSDIRRTSFLEKNGWIVLRIRWSEYKKLPFDKKIEYIKILKSKINDSVA